MEDKEISGTRFVSSVYPLIKIIKKIVGRTVQGTRDQHWLVISPQITSDSLDNNLELEKDNNTKNGSILTILGKQSVFSVWDAEMNFVTSPIIMPFDNLYDTIKSVKKANNQSMQIRCNDNRQNLNEPIGWIEFTRTDAKIPFWEYEGQPIMKDGNGLFKTNVLSFRAALDIATTAVKIPNNRYSHTHTNNDDEPVFFKSNQNETLIFGGTYGSVSYGLVATEYLSQSVNEFWKEFSIPYSVARSFVKMHEVFSPPSVDEIRDSNIVFTDNGGVENAKYLNISGIRGNQGYDYNVITETGESGNIFDIFMDHMKNRRLVTTFNFKHILEPLKELYKRFNTANGMDTSNEEVCLTGETGVLTLLHIKNEFYYDNGEQKCNQLFNPLAINNTPIQPFGRKSLNYQKFYKFIKAAERNNYSKINLYDCPNGIILETKDQSGILFRTLPF